MIPTNLQTEEDQLKGSKEVNQNFSKITTPSRQRKNTRMVKILNLDKDKGRYRWLLTSKWWGKQTHSF